MEWKFAFGFASEELFFVTTQPSDPKTPGQRQQSSVTTFSDENVFLKLVIAADLGHKKTLALATAVLVAVSKPVSPPAWINVTLTTRQIDLLHLRRTPEPGPGAVLTGAPVAPSPVDSPSVMPQFYDLLMQTPTPIAMLWGPEYRFTFVNASYAELIGHDTISRILGKTLLEAYPEMYELHCNDMLDRVFATGVPQHVHEAFCSFRLHPSGQVKDFYCNISYVPITGPLGDVVGILLQTVDVTEQVLARSVQEHREKLLYRQWAELESLYSSAPVGLALINAADLRILRINQRVADMIGRDAASLNGKILTDVLTVRPELLALLARARKGETIENHLVLGQIDPENGHQRSWLVSYAPTYAADGKVEAITSVNFENAVFEHPIPTASKQLVRAF